MNSSADVVIVGGGIGGASLATVLARSGVDVVVLERDRVYRDKIRGENLQPWGVAEAQRLGIHDALLDAGGGYCARLFEYVEGLDPEECEARAIPLDAMVAGVRGTINAGHPESCEALARAAVGAGARLKRGVGAIVVEAGASPRVRYEVDGAAESIDCRWIVGADGRHSSVRRQIGKELHETVPRTLCAGLLVEGLSERFDGIEAVGTEGDRHYFVFPRPGGKARLYVLWNGADKHRFVGADRHLQVLEAFRVRSMPLGGEVAEARAAGPCACYPMNDTWVEDPVVEGAVLIGDAAGWNDPIIGEGLSIALRDARMVSDVLLSDEPWCASAFGRYVEERRERMRRLRLTAQLITDIRATFTCEGAARRRRIAGAADDPMIAALVTGALAGPETAPAEAYSERNLDRIRAM